MGALIYCFYQSIDQCLTLGHSFELSSSNIQVKNVTAMWEHFN